MLFEFCIPLHNVHQAQQELFATAAPADSSFAPGLGLGRRLRGLLRARGPPPARGPPAWGPARRRGPPAWGLPAYGAYAGVRGLLGV